MKITKKAFINALVNNNSAFVGLTRRLYAKDEIKDFEPEKLEKGTCIARSRDLAFAGGSHLYFDQIGSKYNFFVYDYPKYKIYICHNTWYDDFDQKEYGKALYYLIEN